MLHGHNNRKTYNTLKLFAFLTFFRNFTLDKGRGTP
jgi:hypothetical protein